MTEGIRISEVKWLENISRKGTLITTFAFVTREGIGVVNMIEDVIIAKLTITKLVAKNK